MGEEDPEDERQLFRDAMRGVRRFAPPPPPVRNPPPPRAAKRARRRAEGAAAAPAPAVAEATESALPLVHVERGEVLEYRACGVQRSVLRALRRGQPAPEGTLDLHGQTALQAAGSLREFIEEAGRAGVRCVRIVHGKGLGSGSRGPVLKTLVNGWLRERPQVLAFVSAPPEAGGTGATLVLLSRSSAGPG